MPHALRATLALAGGLAAAMPAAHAQSLVAAVLDQYPACRSYTPAATGGPTLPSLLPGLTLRWLGTANYELVYRNEVVLLDTYYDRGPRNRSIGFTPDQVRRATALVIGHGHFDHISDAASVSRQTGAPVIGAALSTGVVLSEGLPAGKTLTVADGSSFRIGSIKVDVALAHHSVLSPDVLTDIRTTYQDALNTGATPAEASAEAAILARGTFDPNVITQGTLAYVFTFDTGFKLLFIDSAGPVTAGEQALAAKLGPVDAAIIAYQGDPVAAVQVPVTNAHIQLWRPSIYLPAHHDEITGTFLNLGLEPLFETIHAELPNTRTLNQLYRQPICLDITRHDGGLPPSYPGQQASR